MKACVALTDGLRFVVPALVLALAVAPAWSMQAEALPRIGPAPAFTLTTQDEATLSLADLRGKVVAVSFMFTTCADICLPATAKLAVVQRAFGDRFATDVHFVSVTVDPLHDGPAQLKRYAQALGCDLSGWTFLTGSMEQVRDVANRFGVYFANGNDGAIEHSLLTSLVDRDGTLRVQYMGARFDPREFLQDLRGLVAEQASP